MLRKAVVVASLAMLAAMSLSAPMAAQPFGSVNYITFSKPVRLPGVVLPSGSYIFFKPDPLTAWDVVSVMSADRHRVYYSGLTLAVARPEALPKDQVISFVESRPDAAAPVRVWWPIGEQLGREFDYSNGR